MTWVTMVTNRIRCSMTVILAQVFIVKLITGLGSGRNFLPAHAGRDQDWELRERSLLSLRELGRDSLLRPVIEATHLPRQALACYILKVYKMNQVCDPFLGMRSRHQTGTLMRLSSSALARLCSFSAVGIILGVVPLDIAKKKKKPAKLHSPKHPSMETKTNTG